MSVNIQKPTPLHLDDYIAFGCLILPQEPPTEERESHPHTKQLLANIATLEEYHWIKTSDLKVRSSSTRVIRIWILPSDIGRAKVDRGHAKLRSAIADLIRAVDTSPETWAGAEEDCERQIFDPWATPHDQSLFYIFNNLSSPKPNKGYFSAASEKYVREAMEDLLESKWFTGLKTTLYSYQRRSAALMLQREEETRLMLDPRLEQRCGPDGKHYYYNPREGTIFKTPQYYEACKGGILAETMGLGKTLICLALISATKHHLPKIPVEYITPVRRQQSCSLAQMAIDKIRASSLPWEIELARVEHYGHGDMTSIRRKLEAEPPTYLKTTLPPRWNRATILPPPKRLILAATTIIVVPRNLCKQWYSEINKHVAEGALSVLLMEDSKSTLPPPDILRTYDIVLFARTRFELELRDGADEGGRRPPPAHTPLVCRCPYIGGTRERMCTCLKSDDLYDSPLKHLHFRRLIVDEGHSFSAKVTRAVLVANNLVVADHRWVISGTPAKDLLGVELDSNALDGLSDGNTKALRTALLEQRRQFTTHEIEAGAVKSLGDLASAFLQVRPWYSPDNTDTPARWDDHMYRHEDFRKRTYTCFSNSLPRMLEALVVKTRPEDVENDIGLPPLSHDIIYLEPSFYDKLTANLFTLVLTANAITSERTDQDYLFHKNSAKPRQQLITNLRQSAFFWTGFNEDDVLATLKNGRGYLDKEGTNCSIADRLLLLETLQSADAILASDGWKTLSMTHELGLYIQDWPEETAQHWSYDKHLQPMLTGISQVAEAQLYVNQRSEEADPGDGLGGLGLRSIAAAKRNDIREKTKTGVMSQSGVPASSLNGEPIKRRKALYTKGPLGKSPTKDSNHQSDPIEAITVTDSPAPRSKRRMSLDLRDLPLTSPYRAARIVGTTSAKLSYLISQILKYYQTEKILIFYDGDNVAYYIAQMLELLHIKHEIYAKSLSAALKSEYVVRFDQEKQDRVLLMDVKQAALGLNITSASRIYFVNPACRPNIEAQAIKRAHRIGQTRKVHVETLILRGTIEEKMHARSKRMTNAEHLDAKVLEDDGGIREIIQSARTIPISDVEHTVLGQMALIEEPQQIWARQNWQQAYRDMPSPSKKKRRESRSVVPASNPGSKKTPSDASRLTFQARVDVLDIIE